MLRVDVAYALICKGNKVLMVHNVGSAWSLPGGGVEQGETFEQAAIREVKEETGLTVNVGGIVAVNEAFRGKNRHVLFLTFYAEVMGGTPAVQYESEISEIKWMDFETADRLMPYHPSGVESLLKESAPYNFQN